MSPPYPQAMDEDGTDARELHARPMRGHRLERFRSAGRALEESGVIALEFDEQRFALLLGKQQRDDCGRMPKLHRLSRRSSTMAWTTLRLDFGAGCSSSCRGTTDLARRTKPARSRRETASSASSLASIRSNRAIGWSRSKTITTCTARTFFRYALRLFFNSEMVAFSMWLSWST